MGLPQASKRDSWSEPSIPDSAPLRTEKAEPRGGLGGHTVAKVTLQINGRTESWPSGSTATKRILIG